MLSGIDFSLNYDKKENCIDELIEIFCSTLAEAKDYIKNIEEETKKMFNDIVNKIKKAKETSESIEHLIFEIKNYKSTFPKQNNDIKKIEDLIIDSEIFPNDRWLHFSRNK